MKYHKIGKHGAMTTIIVNLNGAYRELSKNPSPNSQIEMVIKCVKILHLYSAVTLSPIVSEQKHFDCLLIELKV